MRVIARIATGAVALVLLVPTAASADQSSDDVQPDPAASVDELTADQVAAIAALENAAPVSAPAVSRLTSRLASTHATATRRATYYQGSALMWSRDSVDFEFDWSKVLWSSGYQQSGYIFPNLARNDGISRYVKNTKNHTWRGTNSFGAGVPTPWGDVKVYDLTYVTKVNVEHNGAWQASRS